jgi:NOL1/NOP2/sun family putative RNA methylase
MLSQDFLTKMKAELSDDELALYLSAMETAPTRALHANAAKEGTAITDIFRDLLTPIPYAEDGFYIETDEKLGNHPLHHAGAFYMQEPSAMMPIAAAPITPGMRVLDLCASPGGKSTQIANRIGSTGLLVSNEIHPTRCATLAGNIERMGLRNCIVTNTDAKTLGEALPSFFDVIVVDAPCSGEGMFRKMPEAIDEWNEELPRLCAERQRSILDDIVPALRPSGLLVYSTCTFSREENEDTVRYFTKTHPDFSLESLPDAVLSHTVGECEAMRRFYPHVARGEGQFCALLRRSASLPVASPSKSNERTKEKRPQSLSPCDLKLISDFLHDVLRQNDLPTPILFKGSIVLAPTVLPLPERMIYSAGVTVGSITKGRIVPHHAFFSAYGASFRRRLELPLDDPRVAAYLHGDTVKTDLPNGWAVVTVEGYPLGGIKVSDHTAKNHYPKGLRKMG